MDLMGPLDMMEDIPLDTKAENRLPIQIFPDPVEVVLGPEGMLTCVDHGKERLPSIVVEPTDVSEVESGELRWPPEDMDLEDDEDLFLEQCIPPANIADWGVDEEEEVGAASVIVNHHQQHTSLLGRSKLKLVSPVPKAVMQPEHRAETSPAAHLICLNTRHDVLITLEELTQIVDTLPDSGCTHTTLNQLRSSGKTKLSLNVCVAGPSGITSSISSSSLPGTQKTGQSDGVCRIDMEELENLLASDFNDTDFNYTDDFDFEIDAAFVIGTNHIIALVCYSLVLIVGAPGNALVAFVTAFRMPRSVNALWFLNLALADLLCCLSLPLLMVPLARDQHWSMGPLACKLVHGMLYLVMYCSVLLLVLISVDRWMLVSCPVWCQNWRRPRYASWVCAGVWLLAILGTAPQFAILEAHVLTPVKTLCRPELHSRAAAWAMVSYRFLGGFLLPFLVIVVSHLRVYQRATAGGGGGRGRERSGRAMRVIVAVVLTFFLCWAPLHALDMAYLALPASHRGHRFDMAQVLALCLAYVNSCLNPIIYVCMGRGFKEGLTRTLRSVLHFASEAPTQSMAVTHNSKSTSENTLERCV
ncbi:hypothetical protein ACEWY4_008347 [Coilia grayii]|uniref:G-protein coupled receptors family 1 profile domain-containing protein n=1 Tax=Coilia grayii TaxID=363190 RepID=A0ABD1KAT3_9TELE